jgi:TonB family protein
MKRILLSLIIAVLCLPLAAAEKEQEIISHGREDLKYPQEAQSDGRGGYVTLKVPVSADGTVDIEKTTSTSTDKVFVDACKQNAKTWKFAPGKEETLEITCMFRLIQPGQTPEIIFNKELRLTSIGAVRQPPAGK